jgi:hypothetical protein
MAEIRKIDLGTDMFDRQTYPANINIRILRADTREVIYTGHNTIVNVVKWLFARLMANVLPNAPNPPYTLGQPGVYADPLYGVWGLALGAGSPSWAPETQPDPSPVQTALISEFLRQPLSRINFVDANFNPLATFSTMVDFQTTVNATTDNITQAIREMGLIGGGTLVGAGGGPTNMLTAPYFNPSGTNGPGGGPSPDSVVLVNYQTLPPLILPAGVDIIFSWILSF